jgi:hypothetical protein
VARAACAFVARCHATGRHDTRRPADGVEQALDEETAEQRAVVVLRYIGH